MQPSLKKNYLYRICYEVLILITPFITTPYVSRVLGAQGIGNYSYTHSIITYFMLFGALGTAEYGAREIARNRDDKKTASRLFWEIELMTVFTSGVCLVIWCLVIVFSRQYRAYYLALTPFILSTMSDISWYFTGYEKVKNIVLRNSMIRIMGIVLLFLVVRDEGDVLKYCIINSGTALLGNLSMWFYLKKMLVRVELKELHLNRHFKETMLYFVPTIATSIYTVLDKTLIGAITKDSYQNGYYEQATKILKIVESVVFVAVNSVVGARISYLFAEEKFDEIRQKILHSMNFIYLFGYGAAFGLVGIAERFVPVFFGSGYHKVVTLIYLMSPLILIIGTSHCLGSQYYTPSGQRKRSAKMIVTGSVVNLCLNLLLIPWWGAYGATIASVLAEFAITVRYVRNSDGYMRASYLWHYSWKRLLAGSLMCAVVWTLGRQFSEGGSLVLVVQVAAGGLFYGGVLMILGDTMLFELIGMIRGILKKFMHRSK